MSVLERPVGVQDSKFESVLHHLTSARDEKPFSTRTNFRANNVYYTLVYYVLGLDLEEIRASTTYGSPTVISALY